MKISFIKLLIIILILGFLFGDYFLFKKWLFIIKKKVNSFANLITSKKFQLPKHQEKKDLNL